MLQQSQHTPSYFHVTGRSQSPHGNILACLGPELVSLSPDCISISIIMEMFFRCFVGRLIGLLPADASLCITDASCWCFQDFGLS